MREAAGGELSGEAGRGPGTPHALLSIVSELPVTPAAPSRVLIVEDDASNREVMRLVLEQAGFAVSTVATGAEAIARATRERPDWVLLDLTLPDQPGESVAAAIRESLEPPPRIVITSGLLLASADLERMGADAVLRKPFGPDRLIEVLT